MKYNVGDLIVFDDQLTNQTYTGIISKIVKHKDWFGGGYYDVIWEYPENFCGIKEDQTAFGLMDNWVKSKEAVIYPVIK